MHHFVPTSSSVRKAIGSGNVKLLRGRDDKLHIQLTNYWRPLGTLIFVGSKYAPSTSTTDTFEIRPQYVAFKRSCDTFLVRPTAIGIWLFYDVICLFVHACIYIYIYIYIYIFIYIHTYIHTHTYMHTQIHPYIHTSYIHTNIHTSYIHTNIHTYIIHTYIHINECQSSTKFQFF